MCSANQFQPIDVVEFGCHLGTKQPSRATGAHCPCLNVLWITPHQVTKGALVGDFTHTLDYAHLVVMVDKGT